jgi:hypothetical protein
MCMIMYYRDLKVLWFLFVIVTQRKNPPPHKEKMDLRDYDFLSPLRIACEPSVFCLSPSDTL